MATWPNVTISTANVDAGNDLPRLARADIKDTIDAVNSIILASGFVEISYSGAKAVGGNFRGNYQINYQSGTTIINRIVDNGELEFATGLYMVDVVDTAGTGNYTMTSNTGQVNFAGVCVTYTTPGTGFSATFNTVPANSFISVTSVTNANVTIVAGDPRPTVMRFTRMA